MSAALAKRGKDLGAVKTASIRQGRELSALRVAMAVQSRTLTDSKAETIKLRTARSKLQERIATVSAAVTSTAKRSRDRRVYSVGRSVVTAPGKALPYAGAFVVAGLTVWEIKDLCATVRDMDEIQRAAGVPEAEAKSEPAVCSVRVPSRDKLLAQIEGSAKKAWEGRKKYVPDLPDWEDIRDSWRDAWRSTVPDILRGALQGNLDP